MQYETKQPSWDKIINILLKILLILLIPVSLYCINITAYIYTEISENELDSINALKESFGNLSFKINLSFLAIIATLLLVTVTTLHITFFTALKLGSKQKYTQHIRWRVTWLGIGITLLFISLLVFSDQQFSMLVGILSVLALSLQIPNFLSSGDKK